MVSRLYFWCRRNKKQKKILDDITKELRTTKRFSTDEKVVQDRYAQAKNLLEYMEKHPMTIKDQAYTEQQIADQVKQQNTYYQQYQLTENNINDKTLKVKRNLDAATEKISFSESDNKTIEEVGKINTARTNENQKIRKRDQELTLIEIDQKREITQAKLVRNTSTELNKRNKELLDTRSEIKREIEKFDRSFLKRFFNIFTGQREKLVEKENQCKADLAKNKQELHSQTKIMNTITLKFSNHQESLVSISQNNTLSVKNLNDLKTQLVNLEKNLPKNTHPLIGNNIQSLKSVLDSDIKRAESKIHTANDLAKSFENVTKEQSNKNDKSFGTITQKASKISKENKLQKDKQPSFSRDNESRT
ncbi:hypothetical protein HWD75_12915 [Enterococcus hirae]|uniref:hypothetical protein n=1 Tax=Enterococcus hirae TaxID=1354 RepID=UPI0015F27E96|nr:hypothetical protein [Enterococcus hirae]MBA5277357.1 hypothetical protein [Enterococcus hirae]